VTATADPVPGTAGRAERIAALRYEYESRDKVVVEACDLCGGQEWVVIAQRDRYGFPAQATACRDCSLTILNPRMTASEYERFYRSVYRPLVSAYHGRRIDAQTVQAEQDAYARELEVLLEPCFKASGGGAFLDVGGSTGVVASHLARRFSLRPTVLDPAGDEVSEARSLGIETVTAFVEDWDPGDRRFRVIGMFQTIDHLLELDRTLRKLRDIIDADGLFIVDVVDFRAAYLKRWSVEEAIKIDHPYSLTEDTAVAALARAGFRPVRTWYSADHHLVGYACRPVEPVPDAKPDPERVDRFFRELRFVQNAPRPRPTPS
jgi:hypothetical protein